MKKIKLFIFVAVVMAVSSCAKEVQPENNGQVSEGSLVPISFIASNEVDTKAGFTTIGDDGKRGIQWTGTEDVTEDISVLWYTDASNHQKFSTTESGSTATFTGLAEEVDEFYAVYPYQEGLTLNNNEISGVVLNHEQIAVADNFDKNAFLAVAKTDDKAFQFKNISAFVSFTLKDVENVEYVTFSGNNSENVAGTGYVTYDETNNNHSFVVRSNYQKVITLRPASGEAFVADVEYFISVRPQTFTKGFTLAVHYSDGTIKNVYVEKSIGAYRNTIKSFSVVDDREDFKSAVSNNLYVSWLHGYDIDIAGEIVNKTKLPTATFINASNKTISSAGLYFVDSTVENLGISSGTYNGLYVVGNDSDSKISVSVNGNVRWTQNAVFALKNMSITDNSGDTMFQSNSTGGKVYFDACKISTPVTKTQYIYIGHNTDVLNAHNCDIEVSEDGRQFVNCNQTIASCQFINNIIYSPSGDHVNFKLFTNGAKMSDLVINNNTIANVYAITSSSNAEYCALTSVTNYTCNSNLFYLPNFDDTRYSWIIKVVPSTTINAENNKLYKKQSTSNRIRYQLEQTDNAAYIPTTNNEADVVTDIDLPNGKIVPVSSGATR